MSTTDPTDAPLFRLVVDASPTTGLSTTSRLMVDKITTARRAKRGGRIGELDDADIVQLNRAVVTFLGIANRLTNQLIRLPICHTFGQDSDLVVGLTYPHTNRGVLAAGRTIGVY